jgi:uncharacterized protein (TIGR03435 family)
MKRILFVLLLVLTPLFGQDSFEVASITPCKPGTPEPPGQHMGMVQFIYPGGRFKAEAVSLQYLLEWAYGIQPSQHSDGPAWFNSERYDVVAKAEGSATDARMKAMVQSLIAERFRMKMHREPKELSVYVISAGKTAPKLFPPKDGEEHALRVTPKMGADQKIASYHVVATKYSLSDLTYVLARQLGYAIVNRTGLDGDFDFTLDLTPDEERPNPLDSAILMRAMREQLGLTLKAEKTTVDFLVIDGAEKVVAGN